MFRVGDIVEYIRENSVRPYGTRGVVEQDSKNCYAKWDAVYWPGTHCGTDGARIIQSFDDESEMVFDL